MRQRAKTSSPVRSAGPARRDLRRRTPRLLVALLVAVGALVMLAVSNPGAAHAADGDTAGTPPGKAWVRVGHFVPGMGAVSVDVQPLGGPGAGTALAGHATYGDVSSYQQLAPGSYTVNVSLRSEPEDSAPILSRSLVLYAGQARTLAVLGAVTTPRLAVLSDDLTPPAAGTARVRVLSALSGADTVTVSAVGGPTIAEDAVQGQATGYATVPAGSWTLQLRSDTADASLQSVPVVSGSVFTVVVLDGDDSSAKLDVVTDAAGAMTAPRGGAETGLGGTAPGADDSSQGGGLTRGGLGAVALALAGAVVVIRRARRGARGLR